MLTIKLPPEIERRLAALAMAAGRSESDYVHDVLVEYLGDIEDNEIAERRMKEIQAGRSRTYTLEEVECDLGLAPSVSINAR